MKNKPVKRIILFAVAALAITAGFVFLKFYSEYMQLNEIGVNFTKVFWTDFNVTAITYVTAFTVFFVLILMNFFWIRGNLIHIDLSFSYLRKKLPLVIISIFAAGILAYFTTARTADKFMPYLTSEWFNLGDPIFHQDMGYYFFQRPFYIALLDSILYFIGFMMIFTALTYFVLYARFDIYSMKQLFRKKSVIKHVISEVLAYFLIKAVSYKFIAESILFSENKEFTGAGYVDIHLWYPYYKIAPAILLIVVVAAIIFVLNSKIKYAIAAVLFYPATHVIAFVIAGIMQTLVVMPNEMAVELPYINNNITFTRAAYNLDTAAEKEFEIRGDLSGEKIMNNLDTINNVRLVDFNQTLLLANQVQSIKNYYHFNDADIVLYDIGGKKTAVFTAAREINLERLEDTSKNYINTKMKYTHGMGMIMNPVNQITEQGQPHFIIKDIPPRSAEGVVEISQPRIYFGEEKEEYVIVNTKDKEIDEIETEGYSYQGSAGIPLNVLNRLAYSFSLGDFRMLISDQITRESRLLLNKNVVQRAKKAAPFLKIDGDPIIVADTKDGSLKWLIDGYTTSKWHPYSQNHGDFNYIRNSVKIVVDAYDGTVKFYIIDDTDPVIRSYQRIYPTLFEQESFPQSLSMQVRYPEFLFDIQSNMLKKYHITDPASFYQKRGMWAVSKEKYQGEKQRDVQPYYNLMKLDDGSSSLMLMLPYTLVNKDKDNMVAWLAADCSMSNYGQLTIYNFSQSSNVYGTYQVENRIDADPQISSDLTLWGQGSSSVIRGNMLVIPIENNILYVEPVYISGGEEGLPEIKRIIVSYGDKIVSRPTFDEALSALFGVSRPRVVINEQTIDSAIADVISNYEDMSNYSRENDWENYGKAMKMLENAIKDLKSASEAAQRQENAEISEEAEINP